MPRINPDVRRAVYRRDGYRCKYCKRGVSVGSGTIDEATLDHVTPLARGGRNTASNLVTACRSCNEAKADLQPADFATDVIRSVSAATALKRGWR